MRLVSTVIGASGGSPVGHGVLLAGGRVKPSCGFWLAAGNRIPPHASNRWAINIELPRLSGWGSSGSAGYPFRTYPLIETVAVRSIEVDHHSPGFDHPRKVEAGVAHNELLIAARENLTAGEAVGEVVR